MNDENELVIRPEPKISVLLNFLGNGWALLFLGFVIFIVPSLISKLVCTLVGLGLFSLDYKRYRGISYKMTKKFVQKEQIFLGQNSFSVDMASILSQELNQNVVQSLCGVASIMIKTESGESLFLVNIKKEEAKQALAFIQKNSIRNYADYQIAKDLK